MKLFKLEFRNTRKGYLSWALSLAGALFFLLAFFTSLQSEAMQQLAAAKVEGLPPAVLALFGMEGMPDFTVMTNYFGMVVQYIILALSVLAAQSAVNMLLREETDGSIEYLYAQPVSRSEIFVFKLIANVLQIIAVTVILFAISLIGYTAFSETGFERALRETGTLWGATLFVELIFMSIGVLISALLRSARVGVSIALGIIFASFLSALVSAMSENLEFLKYLSPLDWLKFPRLLDNGLELPMILLGVFLIIGCNAAALMRYRRKDFLG